MAGFGVCVLLLLAAAKSTESLRCHSCSNIDSYDSCLDEKGIEECPTSLLCAKFSYKLRKDDGDLLQVYGRACQNKDNCKDPKTFCRTSTLMSDCSIYCCDDKDMCNAGSRYAVSSLYLFACVLTVMFYIR